jgi:RNA polymerase sigma-70 factor (ECF subfamily)
MMNDMSRKPDSLLNETSGRAGVNWEQMLAEHGRWLRTVVRSRLQEPELVEDVLQEVFLAASRTDLQPAPEKIAPWLYRVAIKQCLQARRKLGRWRRFQERFTRYRESVLDRSDPSPLDWILEEEQRTKVREALDRLSEIDREVLLLKHTEGWSYRQMAESLGVSVDAVEYRLLQAKKRLRQELAAAGVETVR